MRKLISTVLLCLIVFPTGCSQTLMVKDQSDVSNPVWRAEMVRIIALDLREDGVIDYEWPSTIPTSVRQKIIIEAKTLNENHTAQ